MSAPANPRQGVGATALDAGTAGQLAELDALEWLRGFSATSAFAASAVRANLHPVPVDADGNALGAACPTLAHVIEAWRRYPHAGVALEMAPGFLALRCDSVAAWGQWFRVVGVYATDDSHEPWRARDVGQPAAITPVRPPGRLMTMSVAYRADDEGEREAVRRMVEHQRAEAGAGGVTFLWRTDGTSTKLRRVADGLVVLPTGELVTTHSAAGAAEPVGCAGWPVRPGADCPQWLVRALGVR
jgi:hypothetical protein